MGFPHSSVGKESACNAGNLGSIPGSGRSPGEGNGYPLQYSCLENPIDRGAWETTLHWVARVGHNLATKPVSHQVVSESCDPMDRSLPGSSVHGILQARILEWVAISFSNHSITEG